MTTPDVSQESVEALADHWEHRSYEVSSMLRALSRANAALEKEADSARRGRRLNEVAIAEKKHCKDCNCARSWKAIGITQYNGSIILEHINILRARLAACEKALRTIQQWDCLNPPRADLLGDLPWLRGIVDAALASQEGEKP